MFVTYFPKLELYIFIISINFERYNFAINQLMIKNGVMKSCLNKEIKFERRQGVEGVAGATKVTYTNYFLPYSTPLNVRISSGSDLPC